MGFVSIWMHVIMRSNKMNKGMRRVREKVHVPGLGSFHIRRHGV